MQTCTLPIKTSACKLRCIVCVQTSIALSDVALSSSSEMFSVIARNIIEKSNKNDMIEDIEV